MTLSSKTRLDDRFRGEQEFVFVSFRETQQIFPDLIHRLFAGPNPNSDLSLLKYVSHDAVCGL